MANPLQQLAITKPPSTITSEFPSIHSPKLTWHFVVAALLSVIQVTLLITYWYTILVRIWRKLHIGDGIVLFSLFSLLGFLVFARLAIATGPQSNSPMHNYIQLLNYWFYIVEVACKPTILFVKSTMLLVALQKIAPKGSFNLFMWNTIRAVIVLAGLYYVIGTSTLIFASSPRGALWTHLAIDANCINNEMKIFFACLFNIIPEMILLILAIKWVWGLQHTTRKNKIGLISLFAIGLVPCIFNAMIVIYGIRTKGRYQEVSYNSYVQGLWLFAETSLGIAVSCAFSLLLRQ